MALYYLPVLIRSDRYFVARLESDLNNDRLQDPDFNFVIPAEDRVLTSLMTIEDPSRIVLNQMAPSEKQDVPLRECQVSVVKQGGDFQVVIRKSTVFEVKPFQDDETGLRLDYSAEQKRITLGYYKYRVQPASINICIIFIYGESETYSGKFSFSVNRSRECQRVVIDFGSEASQVSYRNCGPQSSLVHYDILENIVSHLNLSEPGRTWKREDFLNHEPGQHLLYQSFYAIKKKMSPLQRQVFPFNFTSRLIDDELRLFITREEVAATEREFRDNYEIVPNLKLGIERSLQLCVGNNSEDYSIRYYKKELISAVLLRLLRLMISTKPEFRNGGMIVTLLVPNIYTQHEVFELLNELRGRTSSMLTSLNIPAHNLHIEFETISESDAAFMGYQQTHSSDVSLKNGEMALVIDCGKGTTDISLLMADENENYSSFFRTGFAGAGNVLLYGFTEDFLTVVLRAVTGNNEIVVKDFISQQMLTQHLTADVLNFIQLMEDQKKRYSRLQPVGLTEFSQLAEHSKSTERTISNLHRDQSVLLQYAVSILKGRNVRWDEEITGLVSKATECIVHCILASIRDVMTKDIKKRIRVVMLSGRAFYFDDLKKKLESALTELLGNQVKINTVPPNRSINNKNIAIHGAFSGAYKITDFTGIPIDKKEGLSRNNDVLNNNIYLYRGIKIEPGNDIYYNSSIVRRNNQELKAFRNKTVDIYFTRDNIYLRLMENQRVKDVRSLYSILTSIAEAYTPIQDLKAISMFPGFAGELASIQSVYQDIIKDREKVKHPETRKRKAVLQFFSFNF
jgi:hypothetical protein